MNPTPRIRAELDARPAEENGIKYFDVSDPRSGASMRLYDFEWLIAERMDGARPFDEVASWTRERLGLSPSVADLETFAGKLRELGFFDEAGQARGIERAQTLDEESTDVTPLPPPSPAQSSSPDLLAEDNRATREFAQPVRAEDNPALAKTMMPMAAPPKPAPAPVAAPVSTPAPVPVPVPSPPKATTPGPSTVSSMQAVSTPRKGSPVSLVLLLLVVLGVAGAVAYMKFLRPESAHVSVMLASPREVVRLYDGAGTVKKADVQALAFGEAGKVTDVVAKGTEVKAGMPVATLESYAAIEKQLTDLKDRESFYQKQLDAAKAKNDEAAAKAAEAKVGEKKKLIGELEARAAKVRLVAPSSGTVNEVLVQAGGDAKPGEPAVKIGDKHMTADFKIEGEGPKAGDTVQLQLASGGAPIAGHVTQAQNGALTVELPDDAAAKPGDQLRLVKKKEPNVIPVPAGAVVKRDGKDVVFVLTGGEAHARPVTVVDRGAAEVLISSTGLAPGDSVITSGADTLQDGQQASAQ